MRIAVIPARGGSKRIPRKNIRDFCGKPMIAWSIERALECTQLDRVLVSTDDDEIAAVAEAFGAEVPFRRPASLSDDHTGTTAVIAHATQWAIEQGWDLDAVCCIYPTAPLLQRADLEKAGALLVGSDRAFVFAATAYASPVYRAFRREGDGLAMIFPEHFESRSQDLPMALHDAGQFYWGRPADWLAGTRIFGDRSAVIVLPRWRVQDIDDEDDWKRAEMLFALNARSFAPEA